jgi:hypothetical protein
VVDDDGSMKTADAESVQAYAFDRTGDRILSFNDRWNLLSLPDIDLAWSGALSLPPETIAVPEERTHPRSAEIAVWGAWGPTRLAYVTAADSWVAANTTVPTLAFVTDTVPPRLSTILRLDRGSAKAMCVDNSGSHVVLVNGEGIVSRYDPLGQEEPQSVSLGEDGVSVVAEKEVAFVGTRSGTVYAVNWATGVTDAVLRREARDALLALAPSGGTLAVTKELEWAPGQIRTHFAVYQVIGTRLEEIASAEIVLPHAVGSIGLFERARCVIVTTEDVLIWRY